MEDISCSLTYLDKCKFDSTSCNSKHQWNNETCQCECRNYQTFKKYYTWNPNTCSCKNDKYLKIVADDSKIVCDEIINVIDSRSTNILSTVPINSDNKMGCYILHTVSLVIIL